MVRTFKWTTAACLAASFVLPLCVVPVRASSGAAAADSAGALTSIVATKYAQNSYSAYRKQNASLPEGELLSPIGSDAFLSAQSRHAAVAKIASFDSAAVEMSADSEAAFTVHVPTDGLYDVTIRYAYTETADVKNSDLALLVDGSLPFAEAGQLQLPRLWTQTPVVHRENSNDFTPVSEQTETAGTYTAADETGMDGNYQLALTAGSHTISLRTSEGGFAVGGITFGARKATDDKAYADSLTLPYNGDTITLQAEDIALKNDSSITSGTDHSDAGVSPTDPLYKKINILDGSRYDTPLQTVSWKVNVPKSGRYRIGMKYKQDTLQGAFVSRRLLLDGSTLCQSAEDLRFAYHSDWAYTVLQADGQALCLDLPAGEHTLTMEVVLGDVQSLVKRMDDLVFALNYLYRKMIMITGTTPDMLRDYNLPDEIPSLIPTFREIRGELVSINNAFQKMGVQAGQINTVNQLASQLESFINDPYNVQHHLDAFTGNISALSTLIMTLQEQPLSVDYIQLIGTKQGTPYTKTSPLANLRFQALSFFGSFVLDYTSIGGSGNLSKSTKNIIAWFNGGREQAELLKDIIDEKFTADTGIAVNLKLVTISLNQAILAGTAPDVALSVTRNQPVNLGARGVLEDLSSLDGFDGQEKLFGDNLLRPYTYRGKVYALPVTLDCHVMFYRKDILAELGLTLPETWDDLYGMIPVLQRNNMTVGLPYTVLSTQATIEAGIGSKDIFATLILQHGAALYSSDLKSVSLDTQPVIDAFKQWTQFYTEYQLNLEYSFYTRFRTGEMPIAIQSYSNYNMLAAAAPEIRGLWGMTIVPGTRQADGTINRSEAASGSGAVLLKKCKDKASAWKFLQWWVSASAQSDYGNGLEIRMGKAARYNPANPDAVAELMWTKAELQVLAAQRANVTELPEVLGGYYTTRGLDNAFRNVVFSEQNYKEALSEQRVIINAELTRKQKEFESVH